MRRKPAQMRGIGHRSRAYKAAERQAGGVAVCLIGYDGPVPLTFGDNFGVQPVRIAIAKRERDAPKKDELSNWHPERKVVVLERVHVETEAHAKRLKEALEIALLGEVVLKGGRELRHSWRDGRVLFESEEERGIWWGILLLDALRRVKNMRGEMKTFGARERERRIEAKAVGRVR